MKALSKMFLITGIAILLFFSWSCASINTVELSNNSTSRDITDVDYTTDTTIYWITTDKPVEVTWDKASGSVSYNIFLQWVRGTKVLQTYNMGNTTELVKSMTLPRVGTFVVGVQGVTEDGLTSDVCYSNNTICSTVNSDEKAWMIEGYLPSVEGVIIE